MAASFEARMYQIGLTMAGRANGTIGSVAAKNTDAAVAQRLKTTRLPAPGMQARDLASQSGCQIGARVPQGAFLVAGVARHAALLVSPARQFDNRPGEKNATQAPGLLLMVVIIF